MRSDKVQSSQTILHGTHVDEYQMDEAAAFQRVSRLQELEILDAAPERSFQLLTDLAVQLLEVPTALISLVTDNRQFFVSSSGLGEPWASCRETPLSHSFCKHVVLLKEAIVVSDAKSDAVFKDNKATTEIGVAAYLGHPLVLNDGTAIGSMCAIDCQPRDWKESDLAMLAKLGHLVIAELDNRQESMQRTLALEKQLRQSQKMEAVGRFVGGLSHDFNNTLGAVQLYVDILKTELAHNNSAMTSVGHIATAVKSGKELVSQLLAFSRPNKEKAALCSLQQVVKDALPLLATCSKKSEIEIVFDEGCDDGWIMANSHKIQQILLNLCTNSMHALGKTGGQIVIKACRHKLGGIAAEELLEGTYLMLQVSDNGCGMSAEVLDRVFEPYFSTKATGEGTGLGLWAVFGIVRGHNAEIRIESEVNEGTTISIYFPEYKVPHQSSEQEVQPTQQVLTESFTGRVLVVDDEAIIAEGLEKLLEFSGFEVESHCDPKQALESVRKNPFGFDIVISDQVMPQVSGEQLCREIKAVNPLIPVIICSGFLSADSADSDDLEESVADAFCTKPCHYEEMVSVIKRLLSSQA